MKLQIWFYVQKNFRYAFNKNTDLIYIYIFCSFKKMFLIVYCKSQNFFKQESNLKIRHVNQLLKKRLSM